MCSPCSQGCPEGQYAISHCTSQADIQCIDCDPPCQEDEFEYVPCTNYTNRKCNKISELPAATGSE